MPCIENLPIELLLTITHKLTHLRDINSLVEASRLLYNNLNHVLYNRDGQYSMDAIEWASTHGLLEVAQKAIDASCSCLNRTSNLHLSLLNAASNGHAEIVSLILAQEGVDPNFRDEEQGTPLERAADRGHVNVVKVLLSVQGINVNGPKTNMRSRAAQMCPLALAASKGHTTVVELLLDTPGVRVNERDRNSWSPLFHAVRSKSIETVSCLLRRKNHEILFCIKSWVGNQMSAKYMTPLMAASEFEEPDIAQLLLTSPRIHIDHSNLSGQTALHFAAKTGSVETVKSLLERGANPNPKQGKEFPPLLLAAKRGNDSMVKILLDAGADPNHHFNGCHPLGAAREYGHTEVEKSLLACDRLDLESLGPVREGWQILLSKGCARKATPHCLQDKATLLSSTES